MSTNFIYEVAGSLEVMDPLRVYMTSMEVIARGTAVLKCSFLKNRVTNNTKWFNSLYIEFRQNFTKETFSYDENLKS